MKSILQRFFSTLLLYCIISATVNSQTSASYTFSQSTNTYTPLVSPTSISFGGVTTGWDDEVQSVPFSSVSPAFVFSYNNVAQTGVSVNSNGYVTFGSTVSSTTSYSPITSSSNYNGAIAAYAIDLINNGQTIKWGIEGTSPNRVFVVQWD